jgi:hypothetical protein
MAALQHLPERRDTHEQAINVRLELRNPLIFLGDHERIAQSMH